MILLAIETATIEVGVAVVGDDGLLAEDRARPGRGHAEHLHPAIERVLDVAGIDLSLLDAIAVDIGPGLFTGLRVGIAAAQGLALALGVGVVPCTSTEILRLADGGDDIVPVVDLRRGDVAWQLPGATDAIDFGSPGKLAALLDVRSGAVRLVGDGALRHAELLCRSAKVTLRAGGEPLAPPVVLLAEHGLALARAGKTSDGAHLEPRYLKPPDAKANFATRPTVAGRADAAVPCR